MAGFNKSFTINYLIRWLCGVQAQIPSIIAVLHVCLVQNHTKHQLSCGACYCGANYLSLE